MVVFEGIVFKNTETQAHALLCRKDLRHGWAGGKADARVGGRFDAV